MERSLLSVMARCSVLAALLVGLVTAAPAGVQADRLPDCADHSLPNVVLPNGYPFDVPHAVGSSGFTAGGGTSSARRGARDRARAVALAPPFDLRGEVASALDALRNCVACVTPALGHIDGAGAWARAGGCRPNRPAGGRSRLRRGHRRGPDQPQRHVDRSRAVGTDRRRSGDPNRPMELDRHRHRPGRCGSIDLTLSDGKEVTERTALVLAEAVDDMSPLDRSR